MTERLSDERLAEIIEDEDDWPSCEEAHDMARELLALRARADELDAATSNAIGEMLTLRQEVAELRATCPVMPETPSINLVEAVARALLKERFDSARAETQELGFPCHDDNSHDQRCIDLSWPLFRKQATAAINAMLVKEQSK